MPDLPIETSCQSVKAMLDRGDDFVLVDCREPDEHALACIAAARLLPMSELERRVVELDADRDRLMVVHCHHGGRSLRVAQWLRNCGFERVQSMSGGIDQWSTEIDPTVPRY